MSENHLLLLEHQHVFTLGVRGEKENILVDPSTMGAELVKTNRGGDVTYMGQANLLGIQSSAPGKRG